MAGARHIPLACREVADRAPAPRAGRAAGASSGAGCEGRGVAAVAPSLPMRSAATRCSAVAWSCPGPALQPQWGAPPLRPEAVVLVRTLRHVAGRRADPSPRDPSPRVTSARGHTLAQCSAPHLAGARTTTQSSFRSRQAYSYGRPRRCRCDEHILPPAARRTWLRMQPKNLCPVSAYLVHPELVPVATCGPGR